LKRRIVGIPVCRKAYCTLSNLGQASFAEIKLACDLHGPSVVTEGFSGRKERSSGKYTPMTPKQREIIELITEVYDGFGESMPHISIKGYDDTGELIDKPVQYIGAAMFRSRADVFRTIQKKGRLTDTSLSHFYDCWDRYLPEYGIKKFMPFAKCEQCSRYDDIVRLSDDNERKIPAKAKQKAHRQAIKLYRLRLKLREDITLHIGCFALHILIDGMDSHKTNIPKEGTNRLLLSYCFFPT
jgi:hypothetical protein